MTTTSPLLVVEDAFVGRGAGVLLMPRITAADAPAAATFAVRLRAPDGSERQVSAALEVAHMRGPLPPYAMVRLPTLSVDDVPPGTEVWLASGA
ncbi:MAG: hypothetical protein KC657_34095 [Myxococcales bacterium]|nr:hypothetical protein [Myxococcales bacterium]